MINTKLTAEIRVFNWKIHHLEIAITVSLGQKFQNIILYSSGPRS